jgi:hypothetical protein
MFYVQYPVTPLPDRSDVATRYGGAIVNCWIDRPTRLEAEIVAKQMIESEGWQVLKSLEINEVSEADYSKDHDARQYFEQAQLDKEVLVFFVYPAGETRS